SEQIDGHFAHNGEITRRKVLSYATAAFIESHVQDPVQAALNPPMRPLECENFLCFALQTADKVACGYFFLFSNPPFTLNEHQAGQFWPVLTDPSQIFRIRYRPTPSCLNASMAFIDGFRIVIGGIFEILALNTAQMVMRMMSN